MSEKGGCERRERMLLLDAGRKLFNGLVLSEKEGRREITASNSEVRLKRVEDHQAK